MIFKQHWGLAQLFAAAMAISLSSFALAQQPNGEPSTTTTPIVETDIGANDKSAIRSDDFRSPEQNTPDWGDIKKGLVLRVRSPFVEMHTFAGRGYPIFHVVEKNEQLIVYKQRNNWYKVRTTDGKIGWVKRQQLIGSLDEHGVMLSLKKSRWQDYLENDFRITLSAGKFDNIFSYSPSFGYNFTDNISAELRLGQAFGDVSNLKYASINILHQPMPHWRISPFFLLGSGTIQTFPITITADATDREDSFYSVGAGANIQLNKQLSLRLEYNAHTILTNRTENEEVEEWKAGFSVLF